jgi:RNA recognition motif-containing protein
LSIRIPRTEEGKKRGIAFIDVETKEMAEKSMKLTNYNIKGKPIKVDLSRPPSE